MLFLAVGMPASGWLRAAAPTDVFFSEYIEGSSNNKALEIYNATGSSIDLGAGNYVVAIYFNGNTSPGTTISLTGTVADGDVFVVADDGANAGILAVTDQTSTSSFFNGDDAIVLWSGGLGGTVVDSIGQVGNDPGSEWSGGGIGTQDETIRRQAAICAGDTNSGDAFDPSLEWDGYLQDDISGLGAHSETCSGGGSGAPTVYLNEIQVSTTGSDWEFFEVAGVPGTDLSDLTMISIESDSDNTAAGRIDAAVSLGGTIPGDGFWWAGSPTAVATYGGTPDGTMADNTFENGSTTNLIVYEFTGSVGDDVDTDNNGTIDATFWTSVVDGVAVIDSLSDYVYGVSGYGPDTTFLPSGLYRCGDAPAGSFSNSRFHNFSTPDGTPGVSNAAQCVTPLVINEINADPDSSVGDANGDGVAQFSDDEFVEIVNTTGDAVDISGWTLSDGVGVRHTFPGGTVLEDQCGIIVFGGGAPVGDFGGMLVQTASSGALGLNNGGDSVTLNDGSFDSASESYGGEGGDNQSLTRDPDLTGGFVKHSTATGSGGALFSPGTLISGTPFPGCDTGGPTPVINEINADPDSSAGDANGDGVAQFSDDEFVEIVNTTGSALDISGWTLSDGVGVRHTFPGGTVLGNQCGVIVFGGGAPVGDFGGMLVQTASSGALGLNNGGDSVTLNDGGADVVTETYGGEGGDNQSLTRDPDLTGGFVKHSTATGSSGALFSPGTLIDGSAFAGCAQIRYIHEIQGNSGSQLAGGAHDDVSPAIGSSVIVQGIVVGDFQESDELSGFFLQEEDADADGDSSTSEGIFVYCGGLCPPLSVSDQVTVTGAVDEYFGMTQLDDDNGNFNVTVDSSGNPLPSAAVIDLPVVGDIDDFYEQFEGMLVNYSDVLTVSEYFEVARYGQVILYEGGRPYQYTYSDDTPTAAEYDAHLDNLARRRVILDDDNNWQNAPLPHGVFYYPQPGGLSVGVQGVDYFRGGDTITSLTGVLHWSYAGQGGTDAWRIRPVDPEYTVTFNPDLPRPADPPATGGSLTVASFNVLNYFTGIDTGPDICGPNGDQDCRGADSVEEFEQQAAKIVAAILAMDADVVGLIEIENNGTAIADLVARLNAATGTETYAYVNTGPIGTDAIAVGIIYQPATVSPAGMPAVLDDPSFVNPVGAPTDRNRPAVAQTFTENASNSSFTVVVNHLKSKGSECGSGDDAPDIGAGSCNLTRTLAAQALTTWLAGDPTDSLTNLGYTEPDVLIIGDLNSYAGEDPIDAIKAAGYTDLLGGPASGIYSYVFDGQLGYLDYGLSSPSLLSQVTGAAVWNINADEIPVFDYNNYVDDGDGEASYEAEPDGNPLYEPNAYRASDHDPVMIGLDLNDAPVCEGAYASVEVLWPATHKMVEIGILGVTDLNGDPITITIDSVYQDEPVNGLGDGSTAPDATDIGEQTVLLRAERDATGNGRVYHVFFTADDGQGGSCSGEVLVSVPLSQGSQGAAVDDGPLYDAAIIPE